MTWSIRPRSSTSATTAQVQRIAQVTVRTISHGTRAGRQRYLLRRAQGPVTAEDQNIERNVVQKRQVDQVKIGTHEARSSKRMNSRSFYPPPAPFLTEVEPAMAKPCFSSITDEFQGTVMNLQPLFTPRSARPTKPRRAHEHTARICHKQGGFQPTRAPTAVKLRSRIVPLTCPSPRQAQTDELKMQTARTKADRPNFAEYKPRHVSPAQPSHELRVGSYSAISDSRSTAQFTTRG